MQILGLLGMYFDAVVVEVNKNLPLFILALAILWYKYVVISAKQKLSLSAFTKNSCGQKNFDDISSANK